MVSFAHFEERGDSPIYLQIVDFIKKEIISGRVKDGDTLPSRRVLSSLIGINPNTIQKSFRILEDQGLILSQSGAKSVLSLSPRKIETIKEEMIETQLRKIIEDLKHMKIEKDRAIELILKYWEETDEL